jgi:metal-dependent amidase/aminoacylase/carboxypeptidase family protein
VYTRDDDDDGNDDEEAVPCVGFNSEMDALPGPTHSCGHPLIAIAGVAAAIAVARTLEAHPRDLRGRVVLLGTPAEESGGGKQVMLDRGAYAGMDACLMVHPGPGGTLGASPMTSTCLAAVTVEYKGQSAHAGVSRVGGALSLFRSLCVWV